MRLLFLLLAACGGVETTVQSPANKNEGVVGDAHMQVTPAELVITDCEVEYARSVVFTVASVGDGNVLIDEMAVVTGTDIFYFEEVENAVIPPGTSYEYSVVATLKEAVPATGELRIRSNDLDYPTLIIPISALPVGYTGDTGGADSGSTDSGSTDSGA